MDVTVFDALTTLGPAGIVAGVLWYFNHRDNAEKNARITALEAKCDRIEDLRVAELKESLNNVSAFREIIQSHTRSNEALLARLNGTER